MEIEIRTAQGKRMNHRDPICGMTGTIERDGHWFCSEHCIKEFERRQAAPEGAACPIPTRWWLNPWVSVPVSGAVLVLIGHVWPRLSEASQIYLGYLERVALPFVAGLAVGGFIDHFVPKEYIVKMLAGPRKRVIARATLLGFLSSTCSHGCLALSMELFRKGASVPAVVSFLLASPWASMSLTFILISLFHLNALFIIAGALMIAVTTGLIFQRLARRGWIDPNPNTFSLEEGFSIRRDIGARWKVYEWTPRQIAQDIRGVVQGMVPLGRMTLGWLQLGLVLSALTGGLVPHGVFHQYLTPSLAGLLLTMLIATVVEVCSEGTAPLAFELYRNTGALGNSFAFLMGGVVTDYTELGALWSNIGRRTVFWMVTVTLPQVILLGLLFNTWRF